MHLRDHSRLAVGGPANLVLFKGRGFSELLSRPQYDRVSLCGTATGCAEAFAMSSKAGCSSCDCYFMAPACSSCLPCQYCNAVSLLCGWPGCPSPSVGGLNRRLCRLQECSLRPLQILGKGLFDCWLGASFLPLHVDFPIILL